MAKTQKSKKAKTSKEVVSPKRMKEIEDTFSTLGILQFQPYENANDFGKRFQRVSLYDSDAYTYSTSNSSSD